MKMHFQERFGMVHAWDWRIAGFCAAMLLVLNAVAFTIPWIMGRRTLESYEQ